MEKQAFTYEPKTLHFLDSNFSHSFGSEVGFLFRFVRGNHLLPALQLKTSSLSSAMKFFLKTQPGIRKPQIGYCVQIKARIDDREGEILRKNQQWTMDVLLVYVEYIA